MKVVKPLLAAGGLIAAMLAISAWSYPRLPNAPIAVHWGLDGQANGYAGRLSALLAMPIMAAVLSLLMALLPQIMPKRGRLERSAQAYEITWVGVMSVLLVTHAVIVAKALHAGFDVARPITLAIAVLMLAIGNYMGKIRYNFIFGIRTPWTLADERVWDQTHRFAGRLMVAAGLVLGAVALLAPADAQALLPQATVVCALGPALAATVYSVVKSPR